MTVLIQADAYCLRSGCQVRQVLWVYCWVYWAYINLSNRGDVDNEHLANVTNIN